MGGVCPDGRLAPRGQLRHGTDARLAGHRSSRPGMVSPRVTPLRAHTPGRVFETVDYEVWPTSAAVDYPDPPAPAVARLPESGARVVPSGFGRVYALGRQLFRSDDGGRTWANLTAFKDQSVIGVGQTSVPRPRSTRIRSSRPTVSACGAPWTADFPGPASINFCPTLRCGGFCPHRRVRGRAGGDRRHRAS